jgi:hypothetical protein
VQDTRPTCPGPVATPPTVLGVRKPRRVPRKTFGVVLAAVVLLGSVLAAAPARAAVPLGAGHHRHSHARHPGRRGAHAPMPRRLEPGGREAPRYPGGREAPFRAGAMDPVPALPAPRVVTAPGFDTCAAPSASDMQAWYDSSPFRAVGIYIGGRNRACVGGNLTPSWVSTVSGQGWGLFPVYVGRQAPCVTQPGMSLMQADQPGVEGSAEADDAAAQAHAYGLAPGSPVYFDLEAFLETDTGCVATVLAYLDAWTRELHADGYYAGVYSSAASGIATLTAAVQSTPAYAAPDAIWIAHWDRQATTADDAVPDWLWAGHQRIKQYQGGHVETHGGVSIDIDSDYLDGPVAQLA